MSFISANNDIEYDDSITGDINNGSLDNNASDNISESGEISQDSWNESYYPEITIGEIKEPKVTLCGNESSDNSTDDQSNDSFSLEEIIEGYIKRNPVPDPTPIRYNASGNDSFDNTGMSNVADKSVPKIIAKNKAFDKDIKTKKYSVILKDKHGKLIKNSWITLKIKNKVFKVKTNAHGKATFKINKLNKKGKYSATVTFKGNSHYSKVAKKIKFSVK